VVSWVKVCSLFEKPLFELNEKHYAVDLSLTASPPCVDAAAAALHPEGFSGDPVLFEVGILILHKLKPGYI
jgi:hypothetical protein